MPVARSRIATPAKSQSPRYGEGEQPKAEYQRTGMYPLTTSGWIRQKESLSKVLDGKAARQLNGVRQWAKDKNACGDEPPWAWFQYMKLMTNRVCIPNILLLVAS